MRYTAMLAAAGATLLAGNSAVAQESRTVLTYETAAKVRDGCVAWATEHGLTVSMAIFDDAGRMITSAHLDGTPTAIIEVAQWKGRSAATYRQPSLETAKWGGSAPLLANWGGGTPFSAQDGTPLGAIGVSGAQTEEDIACGMAGIAAAGLVGPAS